MTVYVNGVSDGTGSTGVTLVAASSVEVLIGCGTNGGTEGSFMDGMIAEVGIWNAALDTGELAALAKGYSPELIRPASLREYVSMVRDNVTLKGLAPTITGTSVVPHPRIIKPKRAIARPNIAPPPPTTILFAQACL